MTQDHPYTESIREKIIKHLETLQLEQPNYTNDLNTGLRIAKETIIRTIKQIEL